MTINLGNKSFRFAALLLAIVCLSISFVSAQNKNRDFCSNNDSYSNDKVQFNEVREATVSAGSLLNVDGNRNGGIRVKGENRSDVLIRSCIRTWGASDEAARSAARNIRIETSPVVTAEGMNDESNWSVSYEILVPRQTNLKLSTQNGGISINSVDGEMEFEAKNGGLHLSDIAGNVKGRTTNGGIHLDLAGSNTWRGSGLDLQTTNGGVHLSIPENYAAQMEIGTTNGGFHSAITALNVEKKERRQAMRLNVPLNGGGAPVRLITTNGGVHINSSNSSKL